MFIRVYDLNLSAWGRLNMAHVAWARVAKDHYIHVNGEPLYQLEAMSDMGGDFGMLYVEGRTAMRLDRMAEGEA